MMAALAVLTMVRAMAAVMEVVLLAVAVVTVWQWWWSRWLRSGMEAMGG